MRLRGWVDDFEDGRLTGVIQRWLDPTGRFPTGRWSWSDSLPFRFRSGTFGVSLEVGAQVLIGCGGHCDDTMKLRYRLIEGEGFPGRVADDAATFFDEQDTGREIPFVFRFDGQGGLDAAGSNQGQCVGDGIHGAAPSGLGKR